MKKASVRLTAMVVLGAGLLLAAPAIAQDNTLKLAEEALRVGQYDTAIKLAQATIDDYPEWFWGHYYLGKAYLKKGDLNKAIRNLGKSLDFTDDADESLQGAFDLTLAYYRKQEFSNALKSVAIVTRNRNSKFYRGVEKQIAVIAGFSNFNLGKYQEAIDRFKPLVEGDSASADVLRAVAKCYLETGQSAKATMAIQRVVQKDPKDLVSCKILIKSYINSGQFNQAINTADDAVRSNERDWELYQLKGIALSGAKNYPGSIAAYEVALAMQPSEDLHREIARQYMSAGDWLNAALQYDSAKEKFSEDAKFLTEWGYCWFQFVPKDVEKYKGKPEEANFIRALDNAQEVLTIAQATKGADQDQIAALLDGLKNKRERLEKGEVTTETWIFSIDPITGKIVRQRVDANKQ